MDAAGAKEAAAALTQAIAKETNPFALKALAEGLAALAPRLDASEAAAARRQAAAAFTQAIGKATNDPFALKALAEGLAALAPRLDASEAAAARRQAAAALTQAIAKETNPFARKALSEGLAAVAARLDPLEAAAACHQAAAALTQAIGKQTRPDMLKDLLGALAAVLSREHSARHDQRIRELTGAFGIGTSLKSLLLVPLMAPSWLDPVPDPLPPQTLVDLLKHPFCVGEPRRIVLDQLGRHYDRSFADAWEFVDFVQQQRLGLDLTTLPARAAANVRDAGP